MQVPITDRVEAGQALATLLSDYRQQADVLILALPRGGVPVAFELAEQLELPMDLMLVRKLGTPHFPELAMGAIASGGVRVLNEQVIRAYGIDDDAIDEVEQNEQQELQRREGLYRGQRPYPELKDKTIILVDDGLATGSTMKAAINAVKAHGSSSIVVAVPVAPPDTVYALEQMVDRVICPLQPSGFSSIGQWYDDFSQVSDTEVMEQLAQAWENEKTLH